MRIEERFEQLDNEFNNFEDMKNKRSNRPDLHVFLLLDELFPENSCIIDWAAHDVYSINISEGQLETLTDNQLKELDACGFMYDDEYGLHHYA